MTHHNWLMVSSWLAMVWHIAGKLASVRVPCPLPHVICCVSIVRLALQIQPSTIRDGVTAVVVVVGALGLARPAQSQSDFDIAPISYSSTTPSDSVHALAGRIARDEVSLTWDSRYGWLTSLLSELQVPASSQTLVFSKTSMQFRRISPQHPRAIYFNDEVYVGWVPRGEVLELGAVDAQLGAVFYSVAQREDKQPTIMRDRGECLACHANGRTQQVPGFLVRSVFPQSDGQPDFRLGTLVTDHSTPFVDRWGGWYVTGTHGQMRHRGNVIAGNDPRDPLDREAGANRASLPMAVASEHYLLPGSDIVALMLLEHQSQFHNCVTRAAYDTRKSLFQQLALNDALGRPDDYRSESTTRRINAAAEQLVTYALFGGEANWPDAVSGNPDFIDNFMSTAVRDQQGRSLRDLDLNHRLLRYPCSYLVYDESFLALPQEVLTQVTLRMRQVLTGQDESAAFAHLSTADRRSILEILTATHPLFATD